MKQQSIFWSFSHTVFVFLLVYATAGHGQTSKPVLNDQRDSLSWVLGESHARACLQDNMGLSNEKVLEAFLHTMQGLEQPIDEDNYRLALDYINYMNFINNKHKIDEENAKTERIEQTHLQKLVEENPGLQRSEYGFYYEVLQPGSGITARENQRVTFDYRGYNMLTGELLDQTYGTSGAITVNINDNIFTGLRLGLQLMQAGAVYRFYFPNKLVFGSKGSRVVPPFTAMIYEVELHTVHLD